MTRISAYASPLIGKFVGGDPDPEVLERAAAFQRAQQRGEIPTMATSIPVEPYLPPLAGQNSPYFDRSPNNPDLEATPSGSNLPPTPESPTFQDLVNASLEMRKYELSDEVLGRKNKYALELMNQIGDRQQKYGWQSQLVGFALNKLPDMMSAGARNRNYYLDTLVGKSPEIARASAGMFTGTGTGNYFGRGV